MNVVLPPKLVLNASKIAFHPKLGQSLGNDVVIFKTSLFSDPNFHPGHPGLPSCPVLLYPALPELPPKQEILKLRLSLDVTELENFNLAHGLGEQKQFLWKLLKLWRYRQEDQSKPRLGFMESLSPGWAL